MTLQYEARRDDAGWTVFDRWTGMTVVLNRVPLVGLPADLADEYVERLNNDQERGDRTIHQ
ncbi:hypothetical protein GGQ61_003907 [Phenylobacterium haematophilum]|jgi:hypothetical protein|uniref:Uncharacterized protein n=1 Tax=Phenylobacterium haematophilum TaxID=98513 RepID=A0A840A598_9CAUL|nr:hypothetical protein [Phenylobacterium haematophilum]MBB3893169.1 hypothetical protein [Phenylobacterium haematophilum]